MMSILLSCINDRDFGNNSDQMLLKMEAFWRLLLFVLFHSFINCKIALTGILTHSDERFSNWTASIRKDQQNDYFLTSSCTQHTDMTRVMFQITLALTKTLKDSEYDQIVHKTNVDVCKIANGIMSNFLLKVVMQNFRKSANFTPQCPIKKVC